MASLKGVYDPDVLKTVIDGAKEGASTPPGELTPAQKKAQELADIKAFEPTLGPNQKWFSQVFWKPKTILDIPITVFKDTDWPEDAQLQIPTPNPHWEWNREACESLALALYSGDTTLLYGLQGTGKSDLAREWCATLRIPFWRMNCNEETRESHFLGSVGIQYDTENRMHIRQEPTALTDSLRFGGLFCEDEAFRHSSALVLQSLRERSSRFLLLPDAPGRTAADRKLTAPKDRWWYVMTDNTTGFGDDTGTFQATVQDISTLDRIDASILVDYLGLPQERKILMNYSCLNKTIVDEMISYANLVRKAFVSKNMLCTMSVRGLMSWADKTWKTGSIASGLKLAWYNKLNDDDKAKAKEIYFQVFASELK